MTLWIRNVSAPTVALGWHPKTDVLIQIGGWHPLPRKSFALVYGLKFTAKTITEDDVSKLAFILKNAALMNHRVIVQCLFGVHRSGAVTAAGVMMGFTDLGTFRWPNKKIYSALLEQVCTVKT